MVGRQSQEEVALRKAIDQFSDLHSSVIRKEFVRVLKLDTFHVAVDTSCLACQKDKESVQDVEKRLVQIAVDIRRQFNRRAEQHKVE